MPDTARPIDRHPSGSSQDSIKAPVSMSLSLTTRHQWFTHVRLLGPHLPHHVWLFHDAHHHDSFTAAARGSLAPAPACRCRRTYLHLHNSTTTGNLAFYIEILPIIFRTHQRHGRVILLRVQAGSHRRRALRNPRRGASGDIHLAQLVQPDQAPQLDRQLPAGRIRTAPRTAVTRSVNRVRYAGGTSVPVTNCETIAALVGRGHAMRVPGTCPIGRTVRVAGGHSRARQGARQAHPPCRWGSRQPGSPCRASRQPGSPCRAQPVKVDLDRASQLA
jgi:hypothetical protein